MRNKAAKQAGAKSRPSATSTPLTERRKSAVADAATHAEQSENQSSRGSGSSEATSTNTNSIDLLSKPNLLTSSSPTGETPARNRKQLNPKRRKKRKDRVTREILKYQSSTKLLIPRLPFQRYVCIKLKKKQICWKQNKKSVLF